MLHARLRHTHPSASTTNATPGITPTPVETLPKLVSTPVEALSQVVPTPLPKLPELLTAPTQALPSWAVSAPIGAKSSVPVATTTSTSQFNAAASSDSYVTMPLATTLWYRFPSL